MEKIDFKRELRHLYLPSAKEVAAVDVPAMSFLMVDGQGDPNTSQAYAEAVQALFALSYAIKFSVKRGPLAIDYGVMPLEGLWWAADMADFTTGNRSRWQWTMMIMQPHFVTRELFEEAVAALPRRRTHRRSPGFVWWRCSTSSAESAGTGWCTRCVSGWRSRSPREPSGGSTGDSGGCHGRELR